ncbi:MAG: hypothetical protein ACAI35_07620 [Candidatus Methylacidiphilales bacterium]|nr:hypothetical protein [Candidatus Methylacidiphilales bacterium]
MSSSVKNALIALILLVIIIIRIPYLHQTMTHVDDIGFPSYIVEHDEWNYPLVLFHTHMFTYAPLQFLLTKFFTDFATTSSQILTMARLPSLLAWGLGIYLLYWVITTLYKESAQHSNEHWILPLILALFSWRGLIESSQSYNYATTLPIACIIAYIFLSDDGLKLLYGTSDRTSFYTGLGIGLLIWINYQAIFLEISCYVATAILLYIEGRKLEIYRLMKSGIGFLISFATIYLALLRLFTDRGVPGWADIGVPPPSLMGKVYFFPVAWVQVWENNLAIFSWGYGTQLWAVLFIVLTATGIAVAISTKSLLVHEKRLLVIFGTIVLVWTSGAYLHKFPLGPTRHTYVLHTFILLLIAMAVFHCRKYCKILAPTLCMLCIIFFSCSFSQLNCRLDNHVDLKKINNLATRYPDAAIMNLLFHHSWDHYLLLKENPSLKNRVHRAELSWESVLNNPHNSTLILFSHRMPLCADLRNELISKGFNHIETIQAVEPVGSTELCGNINGGNGFFLYVAKRNSNDSAY